MRALSHLCRIAAVLAAAALVPGAAAGPALAQELSFPIGLLEDERVRAALWLSEDQLDEIVRLAEGLRVDASKRFDSARGLSPEERRKAIRGARRYERARTERFREELGLVLSPHQAKRLDQILAQYRFRNAGRRQPSLLMTEEIVELLAIDETQLERIAAAVAEREAETISEATSRRPETEEVPLSLLSASQRRRFWQLFGEPIHLGELDPPSWEARPGRD